MTAGMVRRSSSPSMSTMTGFSPAKALFMATMAALVMRPAGFFAFSVAPWAMRGTSRALLRSIPSTTKTSGDLPMISWRVSVTLSPTVTTREARATMARRSSPRTSIDGKSLPSGFLSFRLWLGVRMWSPAECLAEEVPAFKALAYLESVSPGHRDVERLSDVRVLYV